MYSDQELKAYSHQKLSLIQDELGTQLDTNRKDHSKLATVLEELNANETTCVSRIEALKSQSELSPSSTEKLVSRTYILGFFVAYALLWQINPLDPSFKWFVNIVIAALIIYPLHKWEESLKTDRLEKSKKEFAAHAKYEVDNLENEIEEICSEKEKLSKQISALKNSTREIERILENLPLLKRRAKERERSAKIAAYEDQSRSGSNTVRSDLLNAISEPYDCPYCSMKTTFDDLHADHIHPVALGGLSIPANMVLVCSQCNLKKRDLTLRAFAKKYRMNLDEIYSRLENLGKTI